MQSNNFTTGTDLNSKVDTAEQRKKRIQRIKAIIVATIIFMMLLPVLLCILLGIRVFKLQKQVDDLISIHTKENPDNKGFQKNDAYAYAADTHSDNTETDSDQPGDPEKTGNPDNPGVSDKSGGSIKPDYPDKSDHRDIPADSGKQDDQGDPLKPEDPVDQSDPAGSGTHEDSDIPAPSDPESKNTDDIEQSSQEKGIYSGKKVYLTFDDGPSSHTDEILDILKEYDLKATFFVIGKTDKESIRLYNRIVEEGHTLGMHSYSHVYKQIYNSTEDFDKDFTKLWKLLYDTTGYMPTMYRFPGGSYNGVSKNGMDDFIRYLNGKSIPYYDWNVVNGDATGEKLTKEQMLTNVIEGVAKKKTSIVLMHDMRSNTAMINSLPELIEALVLQGAEVLPLTADVPPIQMIKADSIK